MFVLAFRYLPLADTHAVAATSPLIVIALGALFLGERAGAARWLAVAVGLAGVLMIVRPGFRTLDWPLLLPLLGALLWATYQMLVRLCDATTHPTRRWCGRLSRPLPPRASSAPAMAVARCDGLDAAAPPSRCWGAGAFRAYQGTRLCRGRRGATDSYTMLVWATVLGARRRGDIPDRWTLLGAAVIVASGLYTWRHDRRAEMRAATIAN